MFYVCMYMLETLYTWRCSLLSTIFTLECYQQRKNNKTEEKTTKTPNTVVILLLKAYRFCIIISILGLLYNHYQPQFFIEHISNITSTQVPFAKYPLILTPGRRVHELEQLAKITMRLRGLDFGLWANLLQV